jgi:hypothetical protein
MRYPKPSRSGWIRFAVIPAVLLFVISGCADHQPAGPELRPVSRDLAVSHQKYFIAWSQSHSSGPIETQNFALDARQERQWAWYVDDNVIAFARAHPGRLYIVGDEPDQVCSRPVDYAVVYHDFVVGIRNADPTARVSPSGFAEPNYKCCPLPDDVPAPCWSQKHSIGFAEDFYNEYIRLYGSPPRVDEWRFHDFGLRSQLGDMEGWWAGIDRKATWSVAHGAKMVLGAWGLLGWREDAGPYQEHLKQAMGRIMNDSRINGAVYWALEQWAGEHHYLMNPDGSLTPEGQTYANPLTDIPVDITAVASTDGRATLQWTNTTAAWSAEVEFWVKPAGASSFAYGSTEKVAALGARQTPSLPFRAGDSVMGRVRYYNAYGQAAWSSFSAPVQIQGEVVAPPVKTNTFRPCVDSKRISTQACS